MLSHTNSKATDDVNQKNENTGYRIAFYEFTGTVHSTIEVGFGGNIRATLLRLFRLDQARIEVGINSHLFTGHCIQGETRTDFRNTASTFGDHHKVNDHQNHKDHETDGVVTTNQYFTKGFNHLTRSISAFVTIK